MKRLVAIVILLSLSACVSPQEPPHLYTPTGSTPLWAYSANWYQIFPERFANGDPNNDPTAARINAPEGWEITPWTSDWYALQPWQAAVSDDFYRTATTRRYGGDLQGVIDRLDYIQDLGVNAIYFNPIFDAVSMHKYDGSSFHHIDRFFGPDPAGDAEIMAAEDPADPSTWQWTSADRLFLDLLREAKSRNIRVVIDGVWNHTGPDFWAFRDIVANQETSKYKDWYEVTSWDDPATPENEFDYNGWWGYKGLPVLREENDGLIDPIRDYVFASTSRWMDPNGDGDPSDGIDGWRLDVAEEVGKRFWLEWHAHVRQINPQSVTIAEIWTDKALEYVNDSLFTMVMNYRWAYPTVDFFINKTETPSSFAKRQVDVLESWPDDSHLAMQNLLESHDTDRLFSMIVNPGREYDRKATPRDPENPDYKVDYPGNEAKDILKLMALYQYSWPGAPMTYYGTEAGMWGADDPDDRKPMVWPDLVYDPETTHPQGKSRTSDEIRFDDDLHNWYRQLMHTRTAEPALQFGDLNIVLTDDEKGILAYSRTFNNETILVVINSTDSEMNLELDLAGTFQDVGSATVIVGFDALTFSNGRLSGSISPRSGSLIKLGQ